MKLIDKDAILAVIEKFMYDANQEADIASTGECFDKKVADAKYQLCKCIKGKINNLEAREVDLEKEITHYFKGWGNDEIHCFAMMQDGTSVGIDECIDIAKHFFELGMAVSKKAQKEE